MVLSISRDGSNTTSGASCAFSYSPTSGTNTLLYQSFQADHGRVPHGLELATPGWYRCAAPLDVLSPNGVSSGAAQKTNSKIHSPPVPGGGPTGLVREGTIRVVPVLFSLERNIKNCARQSHDVWLCLELLLSATTGEAGISPGLSPASPPVWVSGAGETAGPSARCECRPGGARGEGDSTAGSCTAAWQPSRAGSRRRRDQGPAGEPAPAAPPG